MKRKLTISALLIGTALAISAQSGYYIDGLRLSENFYGSTARTAAMGGVGASLGGDMGSIAINPAGIGVFKKSDFSFSPVLNLSSTSSNYLNSKSTDTNSKFNLGNIGVAFALNTNNRSGLMSVNFAFGYSRTSNFNNNYIIQGQTNTSTFANEFVHYANGTVPGNLDSYWEQLAYNAVVIDNDTTTTTPNQYRALYNGATIDQFHTFRVAGSSGEYYMGLAANMSDQLYIGASLNIKSAYYTDEFEHTEREISNLTDLNYYTFNHSITTTSRGYNFKLGGIYRPFDFLRLGLTIHTPTVTSVVQDQNSWIEAQSKGNNQEVFRDVPRNNEGIETLPLTEKYIVTTPLRAIAGVAYMIEQFGIVSADYEFADYKGITFSDFEYKPDQSDANETVKKALKPTHNLRVGAEAKLGSYYFRGGYAFYMSPYNTSEDNKNANSIIYSGGLGYRANGFYFDLGYSLLTRNEKYYMYFDPSDNSPNPRNILSAANLTSNMGQFIATMGFKF